MPEATASQKCLTIALSRTLGSESRRYQYGKSSNDLAGRSTRGALPFSMLLWPTGEGLIPTRTLSDRNWARLIAGLGALLIPLL